MEFQAQYLAINAENDEDNTAACGEILARDK